MRAIVLAGGKGSRLQPHTAELPKPMVRLGDHPIIDILIHRLVKSGVKRITVAVNHRADQIEKHLGDGSRFGVSIDYSHEEKELSTVAPLKLIGDLPDDFIVVNGDILTDLNFTELFDFHKKNKSMLTVATYQRHDRIDYGVIKTDENKRIVSFAEKPKFDFLVSTGIYLFNRRVLNWVPENISFGFDQLIDKLLIEELDILTFPFDGYWLDIGRPEDYQKALEDIKLIESLHQ